MQVDINAVQVSVLVLLLSPAVAAVSPISPEVELSGVIADSYTKERFSANCRCKLVCRVAIRRCMGRLPPTGWS